jgi:ubiquinone/menaquinone biosynthesis C-methylase UbiE
MKTIYNGVIFDKIKKNNGPIVYMVYLESLKLLGRVKTYNDYDNYSKHEFKIFLFLDENEIKRKIRVKLIKKKPNKVTGEIPKEVNN